MNNKLKVQINSVDALEQLLKVDPKLGLVDVEIRNNIVQKFSKKYLKNIAHELLDSTFKDAIVREVKDEFLEEIGNSYYNKKTVLNEKYKDVVKAQARHAMKEIINDEFDDEYKAEVRVEIRKASEEIIKYVKGDLFKRAVTKSSTDAVNELVNKIKNSFTIDIEPTIVSN